MPFTSLWEFVEFLEKKKELKRIDIQIDPYLEIATLADAVVKRQGPAILLSNVKGSQYPVLINMFGSYKRMAWALGVEDLEDQAKRIQELIPTKLPSSFLEKLKLLFKLIRQANWGPKIVKKGPCQEVKIIPPNLYALPILTSWPKDGGPFITLPMVITKSPKTKIRNVGMYRMQVFDSKTTGMHWHIHKHGARHLKEAKRLNRKLEVAVALGGDPALIYAATAPLPEDFDEYFFAGFLRKKRVEMVKALTIDLEVPKEADFIIEGYIDPNEGLRPEGPFGDHTGYYSPIKEFPCFHVTAITSKKDPIYPATVVGKPPMEDIYLAKATERIFLPLLKMTFPEIVDICLPEQGVFHNMTIVSIQKQFAGHASKVMHALWGTGQMMFAKCIIVVDEDVNVHDMKEVAWKVLNNIDPKRDITFVEGPLDILDHASPKESIGTKMGIDATRKLKEEGHPRPWPEEIKIDKKIKDKITSFLDLLDNI
jgi:4-hydroxy-3-polyprenylbenzoate decarboxylase